KVGTLNDWGFLTTSGPDDDFSANALLELGQESLPGLRSLLDNADPAYLDGSKAATGSMLYQYRRKDFAYHYVCSILELPYKFDRDPAERDNDIEVLKAKLD